jgi:hypothetical protein
MTFDTPSHGSTWRAKCAETTVRLIAWIAAVLLAGWGVPCAHAQVTDVSQAPPKPLGFIVHWNGKSLEARNYKPHYVLRHSHVGEEFKVTTLSGEVISGHISHRPVWIDFQILPGQIEAIKAATERFPFTSEHLNKRIPPLTRLMERFRTENEAAEKAARERGMTLRTVAGQTLHNAIPTRVEKNGKLVIQHRAGVFKDPISFYSREQLLDLAKQNPKLELDPLYQGTLTTFVPSIIVSGRTFSGCRPVMTGAEETVVLHDGGIIRFDTTALSRKTASRLEDAYGRWSELAARFDAGGEEIRTEQRRLMAALDAGSSNEGSLIRTISLGALEGGLESGFLEWMRGGSGRDVLEAGVIGAAGHAVGEAVKEKVRRATE